MNETERKDISYRVSLIMGGIQEQVDKCQYWNAIARATYDLLPLLMRSFDVFLKRVGLE